MGIFVLVCWIVAFAACIYAAAEYFLLYRALKSPDAVANVLLYAAATIFFGYAIISSLLL